MSKRKKFRTAGERIHLPKPPKNARTENPDENSPGSKLDSLQHLNESEDSPIPASPTELSRQEPGATVSSFPDESVAASLLGQLEKEAGLLPSSQSSLGRFVPQFAKPRKTMTRKAKTMEEDLERRAVSLETLPNSSAPWLLEGYLGPGDQMPVDTPHSEQSGQKPGTSVAGEGTESSNSEIASQDPAPEQGTSDGGNLRSSGPERSQVPDDLGSEGLLPCSGAEGTKPDQGAPQEGGAQNETPEEGGISDAPVPTPTLATLTTMTFATAQDLPDPRWTPRGLGRQAECNSDGLACPSLASDIPENTSTDTPETEQRAPGAAGPGVQADAQPLGSPGKQTPQGCKCPAEATTAGTAEAEPKDNSPSDTSGSPVAFGAVVLGNQKPTLDAEDSGHPVPDMDPGIEQTQLSGPAVEQPGRACVLPSLAQLGDRQVVGSDSQHWVSLETPANPPVPLQHLLDSASQAEWPESLTMELDFLPDSQLQDALDAPDLEALAEQGTPAQNESGLRWPCPSPSPSPSGGDRVPVAEPSPRLEDASETVRGLIVELSNLNRLIMSAHRDLEAFKRLGSRKAWPSPCLAKGAGAMPRGEQPWRDL